MPVAVLFGCLGSSQSLVAPVQGPAGAKGEPGGEPAAGAARRLLGKFPDVAARLWACR